MVVWFLALVLQIAALGCSLYQLVQLTDLELDQINPHDAAKNYNRAVYPALILECVLCIVTAVGGKWLIALPLAGLAALDIRMFLRDLGRGKIDVTEIFRILRSKRVRMTQKTVVEMILLGWILYRLVEGIISSLSDGGKNVARSLLQEAAATLYH